MRCVLLLTLLPFVPGCTASLPLDRDPEPGDYVREFEDGREYRVHVPRRGVGTGADALVVVLHGVFTSASGMADLSGFNELSESERFIAVYPEATRDGLARFWNSGHIHEKAWERGVDDVAFLERVVRDALARLRCDPSRVYVVGHSNGAMMALRFTAERPQLVAAVVSVAGTIGGLPNDASPEWRVPKPATPALFIHGRDDRKVPFNGGLSDRYRDGWTCIGHMESAIWWAEQLGATGFALELVLPKVARIRWPGDVVEAISIGEWGHAWPELDEFHAARECWNFLSRYQLKP